jgi:hypothetical protein
MTRMLKDFLPVALPDLDGSGLRLPQDVIESGWITLAPSLASLRLTLHVLWVPSMPVP